MNGVGAHEVVIESPEHGSGLADLPVDQIERVLWAYRERLVDLARDGRFKSILVYKNHGAAAGATLRHSHSQILATPVTPLTIATELQSAKEHYHRKERCLFCDLIEHELDSGERVVASGSRFVVLAPYASRFPFELFLAPRQHHYSFAEIPDDQLPHLAAALKDVLLRLKRGLDDPPFNFLLHTSPNIRATPKRSTYWDTIQVDYHWHFEIIPRLQRLSGFEWGTGLYVNATSPEDAAKFLRQVEL
jgi:UDPglucose--hexose-1-phosphate uridylyltransferase